MHPHVFSKEMKAVILAAGKGTRMRNLTAECPKPMLRVHGKPILQHIIEGLRVNGITEVCIITGWCAEVIKNYFGDGADFGITITYVHQTEQNGTGKAAELAKDFVDQDDFILTYGDILVKTETYAQMLRRYVCGDYAGILTVTAGEDVKKGGLLFFDNDFCLKYLVEKPTEFQLDQLRDEGLLKEGEPVWYNAGIYIFKPILFDYTAKIQKSPRGEYELTDAIIALLQSQLRLAGLQIQGRWVDVRDPEVLAALEAEQ